MTALTKLKKIIREAQLIADDEKILVAVSGGVDSMALMAMLHQLKYSVIAAHVNFQLRGQESDGDEKLVESFCAEHSIPFFSTRFETKDYASSRKISLQMAARELRYAWFAEMQKEHDIPLLATGHHAGDQAETMLLKVLRGSGVSGLGGIALRQNNIIRPLLHFEKSELISFAEQNQIPYREDSSNLSNDYQRNFLRNNIIPALKEINPGLNQTLGSMAEFMQLHQRLLQHLVQEINCVSTDHQSELITIDLRSLTKFPGFEVLLYEVLKQYNLPADVLPNLTKAITSHGKQFLTSTHKITIGRDELLIESLNQTEKSVITIYNYPFNITSPYGDLRGTEIEPAEMNNTPNRNFIYTDLDKLHFPLQLRTWQEGDYFYPQGMKGRKKLSDYFTDKKLSGPQKHQVPLLFSGNDLVWICGMRMDRRFEISAASKRILRLDFSPSINKQA